MGIISYCCYDFFLLFFVGLDVVLNFILLGVLNFDLLLVVVFDDLNIGVELNVLFWLLVGELKGVGEVLKVLLVDGLNRGVEVKVVDVGGKKRLLVVVVVGVFIELVLLFIVFWVILKGFVVVKILLNRLFVLVVEVEEFLEDGFVMVVVVMDGGREVDGEFIVGVEVFVEVGVMFGKNGLVVFVVEKVDVVLVDKLSGLVVIVVVEEVVVLDLVLLREILNKLVGENVDVVVGVLKMFLGIGIVLVVVVDDIMLDLLFLDNIWVKMFFVLVDIGKLDGVMLVFLFLDGVFLESREIWFGIVLEVGVGVLEIVVGVMLNKLLVLFVVFFEVDDCIKEFKMLGGLLFVFLLLLNILLVMVVVERLRFLKKFLLVCVGVENGNFCVIVVGVVILLELVGDG